MRDLTYPPIIGTAKGLFRALGLRFQMDGTENIPRTGGALLAINHISYADFVFAGLAAQPAKRLVRFMAKKEAFDHPVSGPLMRSMHHIPVDRAAGASSMRQAIADLKAGELVGIFPEATISRSFEIKELKSGTVRIASSARVPLIPIVLWGTQRIYTKDHPRDFSRGKTIGIHVGEPIPVGRGDAEAATVQLHAAMSALLDQAIAQYPADEQPPGSWWLPARLGGTAPTLAEADVLDREEKERRLRK